MFRKVAVIGVGTLGGFLSKHISELSDVKELVIIDPDIVESKNVFKSIYSSSQVGDYKVNALADIINDDVAVTKINRRYVEGQTSLPQCNLIIDCRDVVCDRGDEIDVRFYISEKVLIIDCRKNVKNACSYDGAYSIQLSRPEINKAAFYAAQIIDSPEIHDMMKNNMLQRVDLKILPSIMSKAIKRTLDNKIDIVYEQADVSQRLQCIEDNIKPILEVNENEHVDVYVGEKPTANVLQRLFHRMPEVAETKYALIPAGSLNTSMDVMRRLSDLVDSQPGVSNFIVTVRRENGRTFIELLEETGAA